MTDFSHQEIALLLATRCSNSAQSVSQLAQNAEASNVEEALDALVTRGVLHPFEGYTTDGELSTVYGYSDNDYAQSVYSQINGLLSD